MSDARSQKYCRREESASSAAVLRDPSTRSTPSGRHFVSSAGVLAEPWRSWRPWRLLHSVSGRSACMPAAFGYSGRVISPDYLRRAAAFHGHLGPWLVLGLKAGAFARRKLAASPFVLRARVFCPAGTPYTCFVDGVQFSSGCTMGKGNISHHRAAGCRVEFTRQDKPGRLWLALRPEVWTELHSRPSRGMAGSARLGREFACRRFVGLFTLQSTGQRAARPTPRS